MDGAADKSMSLKALQKEHRELQRRFNHFLKRYDVIQGQMQFYRTHAYHLEAELHHLRPQEYRQQQRINRLEDRVEELVAERNALRKQLAAVRRPLDTYSRPTPAFVKPNVPVKAKKRPGRKPGHEAAHRPMPGKIDQHIDVPIPHDSTGAVSCPHCNTQLNDVKQHERIVEDIIPSKALVKCYHTTSGY